MNYKYTTVAGSGVLGSQIADVDVVVIDRANHNLFQPLLYQVATTVLSPAQIASRNEDHKDAALGYDILVIATGVAHSYFGHDEFAEFAPGLKGLADAVRIRNKVLKAFEQAEAKDDPSRRQAFTTFILVGAGPTGVELASSLAVLVRTKLKAEFRRINLAATRIVLVDMAPRILGSFASELSEAAKRRLENLGVEVRLGQSVDQIDADGVVVGGERIAGKVLIWTAGVAPSPAGKWLNVDTTAPAASAFKTISRFPDIRTYT